MRNRGGILSSLSRGIPMRVRARTLKPTSQTLRREAKRNPLCCWGERRAAPWSSPAPFPPPLPFPPKLNAFSELLLLFLGDRHPALTGPPLLASVCREMGGYVILRSRRLLFFDYFSTPRPDPLVASAFSVLSRDATHYGYVTLRPLVPLLLLFFAPSQGHLSASATHPHIRILPGPIMDSAALARAKEAEAHRRRGDLVDARAAMAAAERAAAAAAAAAASVATAQREAAIATAKAAEAEAALDNARAGLTRAKVAARAAEAEATTHAAVTPDGAAAAATAVPQGVAVAVDRHAGPDLPLDVWVALLDKASSRRCA